MNRTIVTRTRATGIEIDGRNINNVSYIEHSTLISGSEEDLRNLKESHVEGEKLVCCSAIF